MTHSELSSICIRSAGIPPSECPGEMDLFGDGNWPDQAQAGEGDAGQTVPVTIYCCHLCHRVVSVAHTPDGLRLRNEH